MGVVGKYVETFVREAIARASYERQQVLDEKGKRGEKIGAGETFLEVSLCGGNEGVGFGKFVRCADVHLQVEDLEKLAPQLLLDF